MDVQKPEIYVGRLPPTAGEKEVRLAFEAVGETVKVNRVQNKDSAFVTFTRWSAAEAALNYNQYDLFQSGTPLLIRYSRPKNVQPNVEYTGPQKKVFIGGLGADVTEEEIRSMTAPFGTQLDVNIVGKGGPRPCAFVGYSTYAECEACISALENQPTNSGGNLVVRFATRRKDALSGIGNDGSQYLPQRIAHQKVQAVSHGVARPRYQPYGQASMAPPPMAPMPHEKHDVSPIFLGGLHQGVTEPEVQNIFAQYGTLVDFNMLRKQGAAPCAFATFLNRQDADTCIRMVQGAHYEGKELVCHYAVRRNRNGQQKDAASQDPRTRTGSTVLVYGLPRGVHVSAVRSAFERFGVVLNIHSSGNNPGDPQRDASYTAITFAESAVANHAVSVMNEQPFFPGEPPLAVRHATP